MSHFLRLACYLCYVLSMAAFALPSLAQELELLFPYNRSSRPVLEFRYRDSGVSHAFVALGREYDDGTTVFYGIAGFYPESGGKLNTVKNILDGPGQVRYDIADLDQDDAFRVRISGEQEHQVKFLIRNWNEKKYALAEQNCTSLVKSIGSFLGLDVGASDPVDMMPSALIKHIKMENDAEAPLRKALNDWQRGRDKLKRDRKKMMDLAIRKADRAKRVRQSESEWREWQQQHLRWSQEYKSAVPQHQSSFDATVNAFPAENPLSAFWPWAPPTPLEVDAKDNGEILDPKP